MRDREIKVIAGYHEWNIYSNNDFIFCLGDLSDDIDIYENENEFADILYDYIKDEARDRYYDDDDDSGLYDFVKSLNENEKNQLKDQLKNVWFYYMG